MQALVPHTIVEGGRVALRALVEISLQPHQFLTPDHNIVEQMSYNDPYVKVKVRLRWNVL